jgi:hypothetical protein
MWLYCTSHIHTVKRQSKRGLLSEVVVMADNAHVSTAAVHVVDQGSFNYVYFERVVGLLPSLLPYSRLLE